MDKFGNMEIVELGGEDKRLYYLVAPLVMNEEILNYNLNYPFRTSRHYHWYVAVKDEMALGFFPVKLKDGKAVINNYYVAEDDAHVFASLLGKVLETLGGKFWIEAIAQTRHKRMFEKNGFSVVHYWKRYVKMTVSPDEEKCI